MVGLAEVGLAVDPLGRDRDGEPGEDLQVAEHLVERAAGHISATSTSGSTVAIASVFQMQPLAQSQP